MNTIWTTENRELAWLGLTTAYKKGEISFRFLLIRSTIPPKLLVLGDCLTTMARLILCAYIFEVIYPKVKYTWKYFSYCGPNAFNSEVQIESIFTYVEAHALVQSIKKFSLNFHCQVHLFLPTGSIKQGSHCLYVCGFMSLSCLSHLPPDIA